MRAPPRVVLLRGVQLAPWDLQVFEALHDRGNADVSVVVAPDTLYDLSSLTLSVREVRTAGGLLPDGRIGALALKLVGQRHLGLADALRDADIVHAAEVGNWFTAQAARLRRRLGYRLAVTAWETLPLLDAYRNVRTRRYRRAVLGATDLFLPTTERAADALVLEGVDRSRMQVVAPAVDVSRFAAAREAVTADAHLLLSVGRLVWEKGHQDLLRALALLRSRGAHDGARALIVGDGPERATLTALRDELGLRGVVELRSSVPYADMPALYARASCFVLGSLPTRSWEEQFGMVLAESLAAHLPIVAAASGAIPEVVGDDAVLYRPGDWVGLADALAAGPLRDPSGTRRVPDLARIEGYGIDAGTRHLAAAYDRLRGA